MPDTTPDVVPLGRVVDEEGYVRHPDAGRPHVTVVRVVSRAEGER